MISSAFALLALMGTDPVKPPVRDKRLLVAIDRLRPLKVDSNDVTVVEEGLAGALQRTGKVRVLERSQITRVLNEQGFQKSGACDGSSCAVEVGKILGVDRLVLGSLGRVGSTYALNLRLVDVSTGEMLSSPSRSTEQIDQLLNALPGIANDLVVSAPEATSAPVLPTSGPSSGKPWMGFRYVAPGLPGIHAIHALQGTPDTGVLIDKVTKNSPAAQAGLREDDLLTAWNGTIILGMNHMQSLLKDIRPGDNIQLTYVRYGKTNSVTLTVGNLPREH